MNVQRSLCDAPLGRRRDVPRKSGSSPRLRRHKRSRRNRLRRTCGRCRRPSRAQLPPATGARRQSLLSCHRFARSWQVRTSRIAASTTAVRSSAGRARSLAPSRGFGRARQAPAIDPRASRMTRDHRADRSAARRYDARDANGDNSRTEAERERPLADKRIDPAFARGVPVNSFVLQAHMPGDRPAADDRQKPKRQRSMEIGRA
jgi:hypothetical protein